MASLAGTEGDFAVLGPVGTPLNPATFNSITPAGDATGLVVTFMIEDGTDTTPTDYAGSATWRGSTSGITTLYNAPLAEGQRHLWLGIDLGGDTSSGNLAIPTDELPDDTYYIHVLSVKDCDFTSVNTAIDATTGLRTSVTTSTLTSQGTDALQLFMLTAHANFGTGWDWSCEFDGYPDWSNSSTFAYMSGYNESPTGSQAITTTTQSNSRRMLCSAISIGNLAATDNAGRLPLIGVGR